MSCPKVIYAEAATLQHLSLLS